MFHVENRIQDPEQIDTDVLADLLTRHSEITIQFSGSVPIQAPVLVELSRACARFDDRLQVRFYGLYDKVFDGDIVRHLPDVKNLSADCLTRTRNLRAIHALQKLRVLGLGVDDLDDPYFLEADNFRSLQRFGLWPSFKKKIDLTPLSNWHELRHADIRGHERKLEALAGLPNLETLTLGIGAKVPLGFVNDLPTLTRLKLILGGRENLNDLAGGKIESLEIIRVRGLSDLSTIASWSHLKSLIIEDQMRLEELDFSSEMAAVTDITIANCKTLKVLNGLRGLPSLKNLRIYGTNLDFDALVAAGLPETLEVFACYTLRRKEDRLIHSRIKAMGYKTDPDHFPD